jgi:hypothetical protein
MRIVSPNHDFPAGIGRVDQPFQIVGVDLVAAVLAGNDVAGSRFG